MSDFDIGAMSGRGIVHGIEHIVVADATNRLARILCDDLGLSKVSVASPTTRVADVVVAIGDITIDVSDLPGPAASITGVALRTESLDDAIAELDRRRISWHPSTGGSDSRGVMLPGFAAGIADLRLRDGSRRPTEPNGGVLGLTRVAEIVLGATDHRSEQRRWHGLLAPVRPAEQGLWHLDSGPSLRVVAHRHDCVLGLKVEVASLVQARRALEEKEWLGGITGDGVAIDPLVLLGLQVLLVDGSG